MEKLSEKAFWVTLGEPRIRGDFRNMSVDEAYTACLRVIERAAELYSEIYNVDKDELLGEANVCFVECFDRVKKSKYDTMGRCIQELKRMLNNRLYDYCEEEFARKYICVPIQSSNISTDNDGMLKSLSGSFIKDVLDTLPDKYRRALSMYFYEGYNLQDIGSALNLTVSRAQQLVQEGLRRCRYRKRRNKLSFLLEEF